MAEEEDYMTIKELYKDMAYDIALIYAYDAQQWVDFIQSLLEGIDADMKSKIYSASLDELTPPLHPKLVSSIAQAKAQVFILSPQTLQFLEETPLDDFESLFQNPHKGIAVYLGVDQDDVKDCHAEKIPSFSHWTKVYEVGETPCDVKKNLLAKVIETVDAQNCENYENVAENTPQSMPDSSYMDMTVHSGRLTPDEGKTHTEVDKQHVDEDALYFEMGNTTVSDEAPLYLEMQSPRSTAKPPANQSAETSRPKRSMEKKSKRKKSDSGKAQFRIYPKQLNFQNKDDIIATFHSQPSNPKVYIQYPDRREEIQKKKINVLTYKIILPDDVQSGTINFAIYDEGKCLGIQGVDFLTQLDELTALLQVTLTPLSLLSSALGVDSANTEAVDQALSEMFQKAMPEQGMLGLFQSYRQQQEEKSSKELPTLIHFAAKFGLKELCNLLLSCPGAREAFHVENCDGDYPNLIAEKAGHEELAELMEEFISTEEVVDDIYMTMHGGRHMYDDMKYIRGNAGYDRPFPVAIPLGSPEVYSDVPDASGSPVIPGYISMRGHSPSSSPTMPPPSSLPPTLATVAPPAGDPPLLPPGRPGSLKSPDVDYEYADTQFGAASSATLPIMSKMASEPSGGIMAVQQRRGPVSLVSPESNSLQQLKDIQEEFKRGDLSMEDVTLLFEDWNKRYASPPKSFKERKDMLQEFKNQNQKAMEKCDKTKKSMFNVFTKKKSKPSLPTIEKLASASSLEIRNITKVDMQQKFTRGLQQDRVSTSSNSSTSSDDSRSSVRDSGSYSSEEVHGTDPPRWGHPSTEKTRLSESIGDPMAPIEEEQCSPQASGKEASHRQSAEKLQKLMETDISLPIPPRPPKPGVKSPMPPHIPKKPAPPPKDLKPQLHTQSDTTSPPVPARPTPSPPTTTSLSPEQAPPPPAKPQVRARMSPTPFATTNPAEGSTVVEQTTGAVRSPASPRRPRGGGYDDVIKQMFSKNIVKGVRSGEEEAPEQTESAVKEPVEENYDDIPSMPAPPPPPARPPKPKRF
ncbi:phosphoinositide 3-kinase adapter protein 1 isoform X3 [Lingula anatina]|uniref:Phosphoinositide 3-kinase adapter protein 1 isoform X2 n=1 Tax=Lingula anatina TaxID=7574 RepID=A0A1S3JAE7_LINAN|nr:phosphoinositide 3-kinase adapter protein 1 isoform X2 [Lingula anatina]XP_013407373.1 phosphoinositide 3-kinase adapter protein 1 isoform X3 [Lingula anatina]|eukprot:XP_013407372.1 phosphoinositide 3-kinase adapter protein 1 isoform X2 [Lingula anatina]